MKIHEILPAQRLILVNPYHDAMLRVLGSRDTSWKPLCITGNDFKLELFEEAIVTEIHPVGTVGNMQPYCTAVLVTQVDSRTQDYEILLTHMDSIFWMSLEDMMKYFNRI